MGGGALGSKVSKLVEFCHCEDERSEDVAIAMSLHINEITTSHFANAPRNDKSPSEASEMNLTTYRPNDLTSFLNPSQPSLRKGRRIGFTLAEVLITLGIIGVVAALTLPSVINNYKKQSAVAKLQKSYSVINQAFKQSEADNESSEYWDDPFVTGSQSYFEKYYKPYLKGAKQCFSYQECGYAQVVPYKFLKESDSIKFKTSMYGNSLKTSRFAFYLPDSAFYWFITESTDENGTPVPKNTVYIDINGGKSPNIIGKDVFVFQSIPQKGILPYGYDRAKTTVDSNCVERGEYCASKIIRDGWKITFPY